MSQNLWRHGAQRVMYLFRLHIRQPGGGGGDGGGGCINRRWVAIQRDSGPRVCPTSSHHSLWWICQGCVVVCEFHHLHNFCRSIFIVFYLHEWHLCLKCNKRWTPVIWLSVPFFSSWHDVSLWGKDTDFEDINTFVNNFVKRGLFVSLHCPLKGNHNSIIE